MERKYCVSVFPRLPSDLGSVEAAQRLSLRNFDAIWCPWGHIVEHQFRFHDPWVADRFLTGQVNSTHQAFAVTDDIRPHYHDVGYWVRSESRWRGLWFVVIRQYRKARIWYIAITDARLGEDGWATDITLRDMNRLKVESIRKGGVVPSLDLMLMG